MDYKKIIQIIVIIDFLFLVLLGVASFRLLSKELKRGKELDPEILAQYNITIEIDRFSDLLKQLRKSSNP